MEQVKVQLKCKNEECQRESTVEVDIWDKADIEQARQRGYEYSLKPELSNIIHCEHCSAINVWDRLHQRWQRRTKTIPLYPLLEL